MLSGDGRDVGGKAVRAQELREALGIGAIGLDRLRTQPAVAARVLQVSSTPRRGRRCARYLTDPAREREVHAALADHLLALPREDALHESETMFHLIGADDKQRAALHYGDASLTEGEAAGATARLGDHIIATAGEETGPGLQWALALLEQELPQARLGSLCNRLIFDLRDVLENETRLGMKLRLLLATRDTMERLAAQDPGNAEWQRDLAVSWQRMALMAREAGRPDEERQHLLRCREVLRGMRARGMHLDPQAAAVLAQLEAL